MSTTLGSIVVDLLARTGSFETDMNRAAKTAEKRAKEIDSVVSKAGERIGAALGAAGIAAVYFGIARRAFDLALESARKRHSAALGGKSYAHHPAAQFAVARAAIELDSIEALLERTARDWAEGVDHGPLWPCLLYTSPSPRDKRQSRMPSSA